MTKERACRKCHLITDEARCPNCNSTDFADEWTGEIIVLDPENSQLAKRLNITKPGRYATRA